MLSEVTRPLLDSFENQETEANDIENQANVFDRSLFDTLLQTNQSLALQGEPFKEKVSLILNEFETLINAGVLTTAQQANITNAFYSLLGNIAPMIDLYTGAGVSRTQYTTWSKNISMHFPRRQDQDVVNIRLTCFWVVAFISSCAAGVGLLFGAVMTLLGYSSINDSKREDDDYHGNNYHHSQAYRDDLYRSGHQQMQLGEIFLMVTAGSVALLAILGFIRWKHPSFFITPVEVAAQQRDQSISTIKRKIDDIYDNYCQVRLDYNSYRRNIINLDGMFALTFREVAIKLVVCLGHNNLTRSEEVDLRQVKATLNMLYRAPTASGLLFQQMLHDANPERFIAFLTQLLSVTFTAHRERDVTLGAIKGRNYVKKILCTAVIALRGEKGLLPWKMLSASDALTRDGVGSALPTAEAIVLGADESKEEFKQNSLTLASSSSLYWANNNVAAVAEIESRNRRTYSL